MRVAYLINQYPGLSHSFVRREIEALERRGVTVLRYAIRTARQGVLSDEDAAEAAKTRTLLNRPKRMLAGEVLGATARRPLGALRTLPITVRLARRSAAGRRRHLLYWIEAQIIARWLVRDGAEHLHAHFGTNSATVAMIAAGVARRPFSVTVHGPEEFDAPRAICLPSKIEHAAFVAGVSSYGVSQLRRLVPPRLWARIAEVRCGLEADYFGACPANTEDETGGDFVCVGRLCEQKGQLTLIEAAGRLRAEGRDFRLDLIGDGAMRREIERAVAELGLGEHVRLLGWRSPTEVRASLQRARCFVLPSYAEGLPVSIMEAFAQGCPVISTLIAGIPELVQDGVNGWLVPAADADALARAMAEALDADREELAARASAGRERTRARHLIDDQAKHLQQLFEDARP